MANGQSGRLRLVFATRNEGKLAELTALLKETCWAPERLPCNFGNYEETGETFADNARGKALFAAAQLNSPVLADDSGLKIDALGGEPGVRSARYIDESLSQEERNKAVLDKLADTPVELRTAHFFCHLTLALDNDIVHETTGRCNGSISLAPRGNQGFGYDSIFVVPNLSLTFAEISREQKSGQSHRGAAMRAMVEFLGRWQPN